MEDDKENIQDKASSTIDSGSKNTVREETKEESISENIDNSDYFEDTTEEEPKDSELEDLKDEIKNLKEEKIRVLAEMENLRKRFDREKIDSIKYGSVNFARDILSPGDNLERALSAIDKEEDHTQSIKNLIDGLLMVKKEISTVLEKNGIFKIETLNKKFDPNLHQAMMEVEKNDLDEGIVVQEIQTGYMMHERLLRPAMVGVSKKPKEGIGKTAKKDHKLETEHDEKKPKK